MQKQSSKDEAVWMNPNPALLRRGNLGTEPRGDEGGNHADASISPGMPRVAGKPAEVGWEA